MRALHRCAQAACLVAGLLFGPRALGAQPAPAELLPARVHLTVIRSAGAQDCVDEGELRAAVEARLGRPVFVSASALDLRAEVRAGRRRGAYVIDLLLFDRQGHSLGERQLTTRSRHCSALDDSLALVLSLVADVARPAPEPASPTPPPATPAPAAPPSALPPPLQTPLNIPETTVAPRQPLRIRPRLGIDLGAGLLPEPGLGVHLELELLFPRFWPLWLSASYWGEQRVNVGSSDVGARFSLVSLRVGACPTRTELGRFELSACVEQLFGRQGAQGFGFERSEPGDRWLAAFGGGLELKRWFGRSFAAARGSLLVPVIQRRYYAEDGDAVTLYDAPWVLGAASIAVGFEL